MKGKLIYFSAAALAGLLSVFENMFMFSAFFMIVSLYIILAKKIPAQALFLLFIVYIVFFGTASFSVASLKSGFKGSEKELEVQIDEAAADGDMLKGIGRAGPYGEKIVFRYRIKSKNEKAWLKKNALPGTSLRLTGKLQVPETATNPNAFDYRTYLARKQIFWVFRTSSLNVNPYSQSHSSIVTSIKRLRQRQVISLEENLSKDTAAISAALLFGNRELMDSELQKSYQKTGTIHLLSISGLHVGLLAGLVYYLLIRIGFTREKAQILLIAALPFYAVLTGLAPPVNRAVIMLLIYLAGQRFSVKISSLDSLSLAFMLLLLADPFSLYNPGFQLSFLVSFSIIVSSSSILKTFKSAAGKLAGVSVIAQLSGTPVILFSFYEFSFISFAANLVFVPLFSYVILPLVIADYLLACTFPVAAIFVEGILELSVRFAGKLSGLLASLPWSSVVFGKPSFLMLTFQSAAILLFFLLLEKDPVPVRMARLMILPAIPLAFQFFLPYSSSEGKIVFLDVGQGDSILIELPYRHGTYMIDTGGSLAFSREAWQEKRNSFNTGEDILLPYLKSEGIRSIDKLVLTHGDADHVGGAVSLMSGMDVKEVLLPQFAQESDLERKIIAAAREDTRMARIEAGNKWVAGNAQFQALWPASKQKDKNDGSIVLWASIGGKTWLFTGDLGEKGEQQLLKNYPDLNIDVLKAGHHGSRHSSSEAFINQVTPNIAVISAGRNNRYGHPHKEVLMELQARNARVLRTDTNGAVIFSFRGESGTFSSWNP
ncbi:DNA internalization-related competence protein ComEC/Rec2 [Mesobacillus zeae]|nr:DNA internalization-related competence protein ComEC/Rec2 [Mesobacillus zeae]